MERGNFSTQPNDQNKATADDNNNQSVKIVNYPNQSYWNTNPYTSGYYGTDIYWAQCNQQSSTSNQNNPNQAFDSLAATLQNIEFAIQKIVETQITLQKDVASIKEKLNLDASSSDLENRVIPHENLVKQPVLSETLSITKLEHANEDIDVDIENDDEQDSVIPSSTTPRNASKNSSPALSTKSQGNSSSILHPLKDSHNSDDDVPLSKIFASTDKASHQIPKNQRRRNIKPTMDENSLNMETKLMREREKERRIAIKKNFLPNIPSSERSVPTLVPELSKIPEIPKKPQDVIDLSEEPRPRPKIISTDPNVKLLLVNPGHPATEEDFYLPEELSRVMKPYQLQGVQFLWENIVWMKGIEGCILADNMGLGKTLQGRKVMIITPATLVFNWQAEFNKWLQKYKVNLFMLHGRNGTESRMQCLTEWSKAGGVLLLGYEMYRMLVGGKETSEAFIAELCNPGPDLCVIDEGHRLANPQSSITELLKKMRTTKRIVLTGYPLQNRLTEYWTMVDFARPAYLGTLRMKFPTSQLTLTAEFRNMFENPINNGLCADSRESDVKLARKRMYVLAKLLKPFMLRRDVSYLKAILPPKQEYVISVALTPIQYSLYRAYLANRTNFLGTEGGGTSLFSGQSILLKLCNHPDILKTSIERKKQQKEKTKNQSNSRNSSTETFDGAALLNDNAQKNPPPDLEAEDVDVDNDGITDFSWVGNLLDSSEYKSQVEASHKMTILFDIISQCGQKNEKLLIFSQSVQTLDCIEKYIDEHNAQVEAHRAVLQNENVASAAPSRRIYYFRLDGSVSYSDRIRNINNFNHPKSKEYVFLLSTRAGGYGINLVGASRVVLFDVSWNPAHDIESIFRVFRYGQTRPTFIYRLVAAGTLESIIYSRQVIKQGLFKNVVDERPTRRTMLRSTAEDLFKLQQAGSYKDSPDAVTALQNAKDDIVTQLFGKFPECLSDLHFHESLLQDDAGEGLEEEERKSVDRFLESQMRHITGITNDTALARLRMPRVPLSDINENLSHNNNRNNYQSNNNSSNAIVVDLNEIVITEPQVELKAPDKPSQKSSGLDKKRMYNIDSDSDDPLVDVTEKKPKLEKVETKQETRKYLRNSQEYMKGGSYTSSSLRTTGGVPIPIPSFDTRSKSSKPCKYFHLGKVCTRLACKFSHDPISEEERRNLENVAKTPCKFYHIHSKCFAGNDCKFSHDPLSPEGKEYIESVANTVGTFTTMY